jgi:hypothetical protein
MLSALRSFLYGSTPVTFESRLSLPESVVRLQSATKRSVLGALASQEAVGKVSETEVLLQRVIPFVGNSFKPYFVGRFEQSERGVVLVGQFTMHWSVKVFNTVWFGFCLLWTILATVGVATSNPKEWYFPLFGIGMLVAGALLVQVGKWFARNDAAWLSRVIEAALSGTSAA